MSEKAIKPPAKKEPKVAEIDNPFAYIRSEVEAALEANLYFLPLVTIAAIPDMCAALASDDGRSSHTKFLTWFEDNLASDMTFITAEDFYSFRCGVVHQGRIGDMTHNFSRMIFPVRFRGNVFNNCAVNDAYFYSIDTFCNTVFDAALSWYELSKGEEIVIRNVERMMKYRPEGLPPYCEGMPVIA